jgi:hypothetical protein
MEDDIPDEELLAIAMLPKLIRQESGGRVGISGPQTKYGRAQGLTQMLPATAKAMAEAEGLEWRPELMTGTSPEAAEYQQQLGKAYLTEGIRETGDVRGGLMYYHGGPDRKQWRSKTQAYADAITGAAPAEEDDLSDEELLLIASGQVAPPEEQAPPTTQAPPGAPPPKAPVDKRPTSQALGMAEGLTQPAANIGSAIGMIPGAKVTDDIVLQEAAAYAGRPGKQPSEAELAEYLNRPGSESVGLQTGVKALLDYFRGEEKKTRPGELGRFGGSMLSTGFVPGGPLVGGALSGALNTQERTPGGVLRDVALSSVGGKLASSAVRGAAGAIGGVRDAGVRALADAGVNLTPGQLFSSTGLPGRTIKLAEDIGARVPFVGDVIRNAQTNTIKEFNVGTINDALQHIGVKLDEGLKVGPEMIDAAKEAVGNKYNELLPQMTGLKDAAFSQGIKAARALGETMTSGTASRDFNRLINNIVLRNFKDAAGNPVPISGKAVGFMDGKALKSVESELTSKIGKLYTGAATASERELAEGLTAVRKTFREMLERVNPDQAPALQGANKASAKLQPILRASGSTTSAGGVFTPTKYAQTVSQAVGGPKNMAGTSKLSNVRLAKAAQDVLPRGMPKGASIPQDIMSALIAGAGTVGGALTHSPIIGALGLAALAPAAAGALAAPAYSKLGRKALTTLAVKRPQFMRDVGAGVARGAPTAARIGRTAAPPLYADRKKQVGP